MAMLYVMQFRQWSWTDELRLPGVTGESPDDLDLQTLTAGAGKLAACDISAVLSADCEAGQAAVASVLPLLATKARVDTDSRLREVNFGLWQGLAVGEIRQRHSKVYRSWYDSPAELSPPAGESCEDVAQRLITGLNSAYRRMKGVNMLFILSPLVASILDCRLNGRSLDKLWQSLEWDENPFRSYQLDRISLVEDVV